MSENPPLYKPFETLADGETLRPLQHKIVERKIEEGRILSEAEGGGKESTETIIECDGHLHTEYRDTISYDKDGNVIQVNELARQVLGPCDGAHA